MRRTSILLAFGSVLCFATSTAQALGFGSAANTATLGQPLNFAASVHLDGNESLARECVAAAIVAGETRVPPDQVRVTLEPGRNAQQRSVRVTTKTPIAEPVVKIDVSVGCGSRVSRQFVAFVDPPLLKSRPTLVDAGELPPQRLDTQVAPLVAIVQGETSRTTTDSTDAAARSGSTVATTPRVRPATEFAAESATITPRARTSKRALAGKTVATALKTGSSKNTAASNRAATRAVQRRVAKGQREARLAGPRLRLDATEPVRTASAATPLATAPAATPSTRSTPATLTAAAANAASGATPPAASAMTDPATQAALSALLVQERERIQLLESGIERLRGEAQATRQGLAALQAQLQRAQDERYTNPLVLALAALSLLLAVVAVLGWRRPRSGRWWESAVAAKPAMESAIVPVAASIALAEPVDDVAHEDAPWTYKRAVALPTQPAAIGGLEVTTVLHALPSRAPSDTTEISGPSAATVDELIDLQQQREFFVVLGQDAAAIELLADHLRGRPDASPLPYLELLELHRRYGDSAGHAEVRSSFAARFGVEAPVWEAEPAQHSSLEEHAHTIASLQSIWGHPSAVMQSLEAALLGHFAPGAGFGLAAYRELLLIYSIARDLTEHVESDAVAEPLIDLLLPLEATAKETPVLHLVASTALPEAPPAAGEPTALDFDLSDWTDTRPPEPLIAAAGNSRY